MHDGCAGGCAWGLCASINFDKKSIPYDSPSIRAADMEWGIDNEGLNTDFIFLGDTAGILKWDPSIS